MKPRPNDGSAATVAQAAGPTASHPYSSVKAAATPRSHHPFRRQQRSIDEQQPKWLRTRSSFLQRGQRIQQRPENAGYAQVAKKSTREGGPNRTATQKAVASSGRLTAHTSHRDNHEPITPPTTNPTTKAPHHQGTSCPPRQPSRHKNKEPHHQATQTEEQGQVGRVSAPQQNRRRKSPRYASTGRTPLVKKPPRERGARVYGRWRAGTER